MLKKWVFLIITLTLVLSLCGCGSGSEETILTPTAPGTTPNGSSTPMAVTPEEPNPDDIEWLAITIALEAGSVWDNGQWTPSNQTERACVGWTVLNRLNGLWQGHTYDCIRAVVTEKNQYALTTEGYIPPDYDKSAAQALEHIPQNRRPTSEIRELAKELLDGGIEDPTGGATHFFSPISMPKEGESTTGFDVAEELHEVPGIPKLVYFPSWTKTYAWVGELNNVSRAYFMFYRSGAPPTPHEVSIPTFEESGWSTPVNISYVPPPVSIKEGGRVVYPRSPILATDNSNILHVIWIEQEKEGIKETLEGEVWDWRFNIKKYLSYSFKKDGVWSEPVQLFSFNEIQPYYITEQENFTKLRLVTDKNDTLHLIWSLVETKSEDVERGETPTTRLLTSIKDEGIFYSQKPKSGKWSEPEVIFNPQENGQDRISQILLTVDSNCQPYIICRLPDYSIYQITKDGNNDWFSSPLVFKTSNDILAHPKYFWATIDDKDTRHLIWSEKENRLYYAIKLKGKDWQIPVEISQGRELHHLDSFFAAALDKKGNLHFAWRDNRSPNPIIYAFMPRNGILSDSVHLTEDSGPSLVSEWGVCLVLDIKNTPCVVWVDEGFENPEEKTGFQSQIMHSAKLEEDGWSEPIVISDNLGEFNIEPYLLGSKEALHLVFASREGVYKNIFYSFKPLK